MWWLANCWGMIYLRWWRKTRMTLLFYPRFNSLAAKHDLMWSVALSALESLCSKQWGTRSDCSSGSSLILVHTVCLYAEISLWLTHLHQADDSSRQLFHMHFFRKTMPCELPHLTNSGNTCKTIKMRLDARDVLQGTEEASKSRDGIIISHEVCWWGRSIS